MDEQRHAEKLTLDQLRPRDAGEVLTLQRAAYVTEAQLYGDPFLPALTQTLAEVEEDLRGPALGVRVGSRLVGSVRWTIEDGVAYIGRLIVAPDMQGQGIGTWLLEAAERASGVSVFELFTGDRSEANIRLYTRSGYVPTGTKSLSEGVDIIYLRKGASAPSV